MSEAEIVITGAGLVSCLGITAQQTWDAVCRGECGMGPMSALETPLPPGQTGGQAMDLPVDFSPDLKREARYLKWTIQQAVRDAGLWETLPTRTSVMLGTTLHGMRAAGEFFRANEPSPLRHFLAGNTLASAIEGLGVTGLCATTCSACSSSLGAIALAVTMLRTNQADVVITGGYDTVSEYVFGGFNSLRLVAEGPLRPFSRQRAGMKLAEGYGIVILERRDLARDRGAKIHAMIAGCGESADAHHLTEPHPHGRGAAEAIGAALKSANIFPDQVNFIAAHATGTTDNDAAEYAALRSVFGEHLPAIPVVAFKSHLGHTLGGAGAVELILSMCALRDQIIPSCANSVASDIEFHGLNLSTQQRVNPTSPLTTAVNVSLGFGGANTAVVLRRMPPVAKSQISKFKFEITNSPAPQYHGKGQNDCTVAITGIGVVLPGAVGNEALIELLSRPSMSPVHDTGAIPDEQYLHLLNARRVRRMSDYVKLTLAATMLACRDAGVDADKSWLENCPAILGTTHGSSNYSVEYYRGIVQQGWLGANPMLFAEGVPNAAAAHLSLMLGLRRSCQTLIGTRTAGIDALGLAFSRIACGQWNRAIVSAGEEYSPVVNSAYRHCGLCAGEIGAPAFGEETGFVVGAGAVSFILESAESAQNRGAVIHGYIDGFASRHSSPAGMPKAIAAILSDLGDAPELLGSANATWLDRAERLGSSRSKSPRQPRTIYGHLPELFSAGLLANIAGVLLSGSTPPVSGRKSESASFNAICTDFTGCVSGLHCSSGSSL